MSISINPIEPWPLVAIGALAVVILTVWAYRERLRGTTGGWRWVALGLRLMAVALCVFAALRPSVNFPEKKAQPAAVVFMLDRSRSLTIGDEVNGQTRWQVARKAFDEARKSMEGRSKDLEIREYLFDSTLHEEKVDDATKPEGSESSIGSTLVEAVKRVAGINIAAVVLISDGANNSGMPPLIAANQLKGKLVPVITVGVGQEGAGAESKDIAVRDLIVGPTVFVKNQPEIRGTISVRGYPNKAIDVELYVEGEPGVAAKTTIKPTSASEIIPITGLKYLPQTPGEKRVTLKVKPQEGELVRTNNEFTTYLTVLKGGLKVLYVQGEHFSWEFRFLTMGLDAAKEIHVDLTVLRQPAIGDKSLIDDAEFAPGNYDVFILGDLPAAQLTTRQHRLLATAVSKGAGLIMLGGRSSFGEGGWGNTDLAGVLPVTIRAGDGQTEPADGLKFEPNAFGLQNYLLRLAPTPDETRRIWDELPPLTGANRIEAKPAAFVLATAKGAGREPLMVGMESGKGRTLAFAGETWPWYRAGDTGLLAYRRFWRQVILWLAHKEDQGESEIKVRLDRRRLPVGGRLDLVATARDAKKEPIADVQFVTTVTRVDPAETPPKPVPVQLFPQGDEAKGFHPVEGMPGEYRVEVTGDARGDRDRPRLGPVQRL